MCKWPRRWTSFSPSRLRSVFIVVAALMIVVVWVIFLNLDLSVEYSVGTPPQPPPFRSFLNATAPKVESPNQFHRPSDDNSPETLQVEFGERLVTANGIPIQISPTSVARGVQQDAAASRALLEEAVYAVNFASLERRLSISGKIAGKEAVLGTSSTLRPADKDGELKYVITQARRRWLRLTDDEKALVEAERRDHPDVAVEFFATEADGQCSKRHVFAPQTFATVPATGMYGLPETWSNVELPAADEGTQVDPLSGFCVATSNESLRLSKGCLVHRPRHPPRHNEAGGQDAARTDGGHRILLSRAYSPGDPMPLLAALIKEYGTAALFPNVFEALIMSPSKRRALKRSLEASLALLSQETHSAGPVQTIGETVRCIAKLSHSPWHSSFFNTLSFGTFPFSSSEFMQSLLSSSTADVEVKNLSSVVEGVVLLLGDSSAVARAWAEDDDSHSRLARRVAVPAGSSMEVAKLAQDTQEELSKWYQRPSAALDDTWGRITDEEATGVALGPALRSPLPKHFTIHRVPSDDVTLFVHALPSPSLANIVSFLSQAVASVRCMASVSAKLMLLRLWLTRHDTAFDRERRRVESVAPMELLIRTAAFHNASMGLCGGPLVHRAAGRLAGWMGASLDEAWRAFDSIVMPAYTHSPGPAPPDVKDVIEVIDFNSECGALATALWRRDGVTVRRFVEDPTVAAVAMVERCVMRSEIRQAALQHFLVQAHYSSSATHLVRNETAGEHEAPIRKLCPASRREMSPLRHPAGPVAELVADAAAAKMQRQVSERAGPLDAPDTEDERHKSRTLLAAFRERGRRQLDLEIIPEVGRFYAAKHTGAPYTIHHYLLGRTDPHTSGCLMTTPADDAAAGARAVCDGDADFEALSSATAALDVREEREAREHAVREAKDKGEEVSVLEGPRRIDNRFDFRVSTVVHEGARSRSSRVYRRRLPSTTLDGAMWGWRHERHLPPPTHLFHELSNSLLRRWSKRDNDNVVEMPPTNDHTLVAGRSHLSVLHRAQISTDACEFIGTSHDYCSVQPPVLTSGATRFLDVLSALAGLIPAVSKDFSMQNWCPLNTVPPAKECPSEAVGVAVALFAAERVQTAHRHHLGGPDTAILHALLMFVRFKHYLMVIHENEGSSAVSSKNRVLLRTVLEGSAQIFSRESTRPRLLLHIGYDVDPRSNAVKMRGGKHTSIDESMRSMGYRCYILSNGRAVHAVLNTVTSGAVVMWLLDGFDFILNV